VLTVFVDLVVAVNRRRGARGAAVHAAHGRNRARRAAALRRRARAKTWCCRTSVLVYRIEGPSSLALAEKLRTHARTICSWTSRRWCCDSAAFPFMDATGLNTLGEIVGRMKRRNVRVLLCGIHPALRASLESYRHHRTGRRVQHYVRTCARCAAREQADV
jgi:SulP family sulfate permease